MKAMGIERVTNFPFPTPPELTAVKAAIATLINLGAISPTNDSITLLGKTLANFPVAARFAKMMLLAKQVGCIEYIIAVVAGLTGQSPFIHVLERKEKEIDEQENKADDGEVEDGMYEIFSNAIYF